MRVSRGWRGEKEAKKKRVWGVEFFRRRPKRHTTRSSCCLVPLFSFSKCRPRLCALLVCPLSACEREEGGRRRRRLSGKQNALLARRRHTAARAAWARLCASPSPFPPPPPARTTTRPTRDATHLPDDAPLSLSLFHSTAPRRAPRRAAAPARALFGGNKEVKRRERERDGQGAESHQQQKHPTPTSLSLSLSFLRAAAAATRLPTCRASWRTCAKRRRRRPACRWS